MSALKSLALLLLIGLTSVLVTAAGPAVSVAQLTAINGQVSGNAASIVIEATQRSAYVATRPDPLTVFVDFRNASAAGVSNHFTRNASRPIAAVAVEPAETPGSPASRVRITLAEAVAHHVRADRNRIVVDFDKSSASASDVLPPVMRARPDAMAALANAPAGPAMAAGAMAALTLQQRSPAASARPATAAQATLAAAQQPPASGQAVAPTASERRFTGTPISLDFQGADLRAVLRTFAEVSGLNMVIDPAVSGTVDVALRDVPWDQALDTILRANKLGYVVDGTIIRIAPREVFSAEERARVDDLDVRAKADKARAAAEQLTTTTRQLSYAKGEDIVKLLKETRVLSEFGQAQVDPRTNTVIITDVADQIPQAQAFIDKLDQAQPQVEIEARIVQTGKDYARQLGVQWGFNGRVDPQLGNTTNLAFPNNGSIGGQAIGPPGTAVNLPVPGATSAVRLALGSINGAFNLDVALSALEKSGQVRLLSTPRVSTQNNVEAEIAQGEQIPYQTVANNSISTTFKDAALTLKVLPQITASGTVIMMISVDNGSRGPDAGSPPQPSIRTQRARTTVLVKDGETTVIGGIYSSQENSTNDRTPGLSRVPLLKWLFKRDSVSDSNSELLIFITPRIIK